MYIAAGGNGVEMLRREIEAHTQNRRWGEKRMDGGARPLGPCRQVVRIGETESTSMRTLLSTCAHPGRGLSVLYSGKLTTTYNTIEQYCVLLHHQGMPFLFETSCTKYTLLLYILMYILRGNRPSFSLYVNLPSYL